MLLMGIGPFRRLAKFVWLAAFIAIVIFLASSASSSKTRQELRFFIVGDFGAGSIHGKHHNQQSVAATLAMLANEIRPDFIMTTGDIIYKDGIRSASDKLLKTRFEDVYASKALQIPWHIIPGNHDCHGSLNAMMEYASRSRQWHMPSRYYVVEKTLPLGGLVRIVYLDTCLLVCGEMKNYRCEESMRPNLSAEERERELQWLEQELAVPATWKFVVGHWGVFSLQGNGPTEELITGLLPLLKRHNVDAYFNGHDHGLQHLVLRRGDGPHFVVSGAGGYELHGHLKAEADAQLNAPVRALFDQSTHGFVAATLTDKELRLRFVGEQGQTLYQTLIEQDA